MNILETPKEAELATTKLKTVRLDSILLMEKIFNINKSEAFIFSIKHNDWTSRKLTVTDENISIWQSCSVSFRDEFYFYGGIDSRQIVSLRCNKNGFQRLGKLKFDFVDGSCIANKQLIFACFGNENRHQCYKSKYPVPFSWWEWFTVVPPTEALHILGTVAVSEGIYYKYLL